MKDPKERLEYLREEIRAERISYGELVELRELIEYIDPSDVELLEWAGVTENNEEDTMKEVIENTIIIEVGGDHGDGNVEVVNKPRGIKVIIRDFDNAVLPEDADLQDAPEPQIREYSEDEIIIS